MAISVVLATREVPFADASLGFWIRATQQRVACARRVLQGMPEELPGHAELRYFCIMENVAHLLSGKMRPMHQYILQAIGSTVFQCQE